MTYYIETHTKEGTPLKIEVESAAKTSAGFSRPTSPSNVSHEVVQDAYDQTLQTIRTCANGIIETIAGLNVPPSSAGVDFGIKIDGEAGAMVARSLGEAHFKVSLSWKQAQPESKDDPK